MCDQGGTSRKVALGTFRADGKYLSAEFVRPMPEPLSASELRALATVLDRDAPDWIVED